MLLGHQFRSRVTITALLALLIALHGMMSTLCAQAEILEDYRILLGRFEKSEDAEKYWLAAQERLGEKGSLEEWKQVYYVMFDQFETYQQAFSRQSFYTEKGFQQTQIVKVLNSTSEKAVRYPIYHIQMDNYPSREKADAVEKDLKERGAPDVHQVEFGGYYRVRVGRFEDRDEAMERMKTLRQSGYPYCWMVQSEGSRRWEESSILSIEEALPPQGLADRLPGEEKRLPDILYQVVVGPFQEKGRAEGVMRALQAAGYGDLRVIDHDGFEVEVRSPMRVAQAEAMLITLRGQGFLDCRTRDPLTNEDLVVVATPASTLEIAQPSLTPAPTQPATEEQLESLLAETEKIEEKPTELSAKENAAERIAAAQVLLESGDYEAARSQFELALNLDPGNAKVIEGLAQTRQLQREQQQRELLQERIQGILDAADEMLKAGNDQAALDQYRLVLELDDENTEARKGSLLIEERLAQAKKIKEASAAALAQKVEMATSVSVAKTEAIQETPKTGKTSTKKTGGMWLYYLIAGAILVLIGILVVKKRKKSAVGEEKSLPTPAQPATPKSEEEAGEDEATGPQPLDLAKRFAEKQEAKQKVESLKTDSNVPELYPTEVVDEFSADSPPEAAGDDSVFDMISAGPVVEKPRTVFEICAGGLDTNPAQIWKGEYPSAQLKLLDSTNSEQEKPCLQFGKRQGADEILFCAIVPEAGSRPSIEFEICCTDLENGSIGLYIESVDNDKVSIPTTFKVEVEGGEVRMTAGSHNMPGKAGQWHRLCYETDLQQCTYTILWDDNVLEENVPLMDSTTDLDLLSLKADPLASGQILIRNLRVSKREEE